MGLILRGRCKSLGSIGLNDTHVLRVSMTHAHIAAETATHTHTMRRHGAFGQETSETSETSLEWLEQSGGRAASLRLQAWMACLFYSLGGPIPKPMGNIPKQIHLWVLIVSAKALWDPELGVLLVGSSQGSGYQLSLMFCQHEKCGSLQALCPSEIRPYYSELVHHSQPGVLGVRQKLPAGSLISQTQGRIQEVNRT